MFEVVWNQLVFKMVPNILVYISVYINYIYIF